MITILKSDWLSTVLISALIGVHLALGLGLLNGKERMLYQKVDSYTAH